MPLSSLRELRQKALSACEFIKAVRGDASKLYQSLVAIYLSGFQSMESKIIELTIAKAKEELLLQTTTFSAVQLQRIQNGPDQIGILPVLDAKHFLWTLRDHRVPLVLVLAQQLGLGEWVAAYGGFRTDALVNYVGWRARLTRPMPIYQIELFFRFYPAKNALVDSAKAIMFQVLKVDCKTILKDEFRDFSGSPTLDYLANELWKEQMKNFPFATVITDNWTSSTISSGPTYCDYQGVLKEQVTRIVVEAWQNAKLQEPDDELKQSSEQTAFRNVVAGLKSNPTLFAPMADQLKAVRALALAYAELIGITEEQRDKLRKILANDLNDFLDKPYLIRHATMQLMQWVESLSKTPKFIPSRVIVKLLHAVRCIDLFEKHLQQGLTPRDRLPDVSLNAQFIDWSKIEIEKDDESREVVLGEGGFGKIFQARWNAEECPRIVAIKVIHSDLGTDENTIFKAEIEKLSKLHSPHIIRSFGYSKRDGRLCLVMELARKGSLFKVLANKESKIDLEQQILWVMQIARGFQYLHHNHIIHCDFKSLNVLLDEFLNAKLNDFGLSTTTQKAKRTTITHSSKRSFARSRGGIKSTVNSTQTFGGSLLWQPPEAVTPDRDCFKPFSFEGDIYSFGVVIWEIFSRTEPFESLSNVGDDRIRMAIQGKLKSNGRKLRREDIDKIPDKVPDEIKEIILACWQKDPTKRPSIDDVVTKLNKAFPEIAKRLDQQLEAEIELSIPKESKTAAEDSSAVDSEDLHKRYQQFIGDSEAALEDEADGSVFREFVVYTPHRDARQQIEQTHIDPKSKEKEKEVIVKRSDDRVVFN